MKRNQAYIGVALAFVGALLLIWTGDWRWWATLTLISGLFMIWSGVAD